MVFDSGYDLTRLAWLLRDLPVEVAGRLRSDRVMHFPAPPRPARPAGTGGRPPRHGAVLKLADPRTWPAPAVATVTETARYGTATRHGLGAAAPAAGQPRRVGGPRRRAAGHRGHPHPAGGRSPARRPRRGTAVAVVLPRRAPAAAEVDRTWQAFLRRFDIEHTFRFLKQVLGWTAPKLRDPAAADRWTWLILACYIQL